MNQDTGKADMKKLRREYREHVVWRAGRHLLSPHKLKFAEDFRRQAIQRFDRDGDGELSLSEREEARKWLKDGSGLAD